MQLPKLQLKVNGKIVFGKKQRNKIQKSAIKVKDGTLDVLGAIKRKSVNAYKAIKS